MNTVAIRIDANALLPTPCRRRPVASVLLPASCRQHLVANVLLPASCRQRLVASVLSPTSCPGGTFDNSPAIYRWVAGAATWKSPVGTTEIRARRSAVPTGRARDRRRRPSDKSLGYSHTPLRGVALGARRTALRSVGLGTRRASLQGVALGVRRAPSPGRCLGRPAHAPAGRLPWMPGGRLSGALAWVPGARRCGALPGAPRGPCEDVGKPRRLRPPPNRGVGVSPALEVESARNGAACPPGYRRRPQRRFRQERLRVGGGRARPRSVCRKRT